NLFAWMVAALPVDSEAGTYPSNLASADLSSSSTQVVAALEAFGSQTPPQVTYLATPTTLWPPNGKSVLVTVSGNVTAGSNALTASSYAVIDEYGQDQPSGNTTLGAGGSYSFGVPLIASRNGNDPDGRTYTIYVSGSDTIG